VQEEGKGARSLQDDETAHTMSDYCRSLTRSFFELLEPLDQFGR
jgi:hypothetical protein